MNFVSKTTLAKRCISQTASVLGVVGLSAIATLGVVESASAESFPGIGDDNFESIFDAELEILVGPLAGTKFQVNNLLDPSQVVARSSPFVDGGIGVDDIGYFDLSPDSGLPTQIKDSDFPAIPDGFNGTFQETIHLQITSLNAVSPDGQFRLLAGKPLQDEFPEFFQPSLGMVVSDGSTGFPARSFFVPYTLIATPFGNLIANHKQYANPIIADKPLTQLPPIGITYETNSPDFLVCANNLDGLPVATFRDLRHHVSDVSTSPPLSPPDLSNLGSICPSRSSTSVPEPSGAMGLLALGFLGRFYILKQQNKA
ncbi:hypothetical protein [Coleofasciculus sp.]|uniref:hypothetical protein n=1 Tax=Coleofasciculus sp. TaxID=3100458 RepID=UPI0039FAAEE8